MSLEVGYLLRINTYGHKRYEQYKGVALDDPVILVPYSDEIWQGPLITGYCDAQGDDPPELMRDLQAVREYWHGFAAMDIPTMLLEVTYADGPAEELARATESGGLLLGFDVAVLAGNFDSVVMSCVISDKFLPLVANAPGYPIHEIVQRYFRPRLNGNGLLTCAEDALLLARYGDAMASIVPGYRCCGDLPVPCRVALVEGYPPSKGDPEGRGPWIDPDRFPKRPPG